MNQTKYTGLFFRLAYRLMLTGRWLAAKPVCTTFGRPAGQHFGTIQQIYVINLDRQAHRWKQIQRELRLVNDRAKTPLIELTKRISAIDAINYIDSPSCLELNTCYSLADQLFVEPDPSLATAPINRNQRIEMSRQEIAVALSHIAVWKLIASGDLPYVLVVEDDVIFRPDFAQAIDRSWAELVHTGSPSNSFDLVYLSYKEAKTKAQKYEVSDHLFRPLRGLWQLSGYVLSKKGANNLLKLLPVHGPVDLWINHQFEKLDVFATSKSVIEQRIDCQSDNSYSILPVLSKLGVLTHEKPLTFETRKLTKPVFATGRLNTGLTSLAMALSMLGYRCCSDINELPNCEHKNLFGRKKDRVFDAYVNIGSLENRYIKLAKLYRNSMFIITVDDEEEVIKVYQEISIEGRRAGFTSGEKEDSLLTIPMLIRQLRQLSVKFLVLSLKERNKWETLCQFLKCNPPTSVYPSFADQPQRRLSIHNSNNRRLDLGFDELKFDTSPWIAVPTGKWQGIPLDEVAGHSTCGDVLANDAERIRNFDSSHWNLLDDTFPSNLALFRRTNFSVANGGCAILTLRRERSYARDYTSASICSRQAYQYGRFHAVIKPAKVAGLITGIFLHRNSPRQEIDIEILGKDTTKLLVNVYYNPGAEGAKFDYGYRGTPALIDLGFDASKDFHHYSIEWSSTSIQWFVDGQLVHERTNWEPTPIPHLPMQFYINLWPSRSKELVGRLSDNDLPAHSEIRSVNLQV